MFGIFIDILVRNVWSCENHANSFKLKRKVRVSVQLFSHIVMHKI